MARTSRLRKTKLNVSSNVFIMMTRIIMLFIVRIIFIRTLGKLYLGVDSLFTSLLSVLSIADLGITSAVNYALYKPLSDKDDKKISAIMTFYKKMYKYMGLFLCAIGIILAFFLPLIVKEEVEYLYLIYFMYLFNTVSTYFISYKESLIVADQNRYQLTYINFFSYMLLYGLRIAAILLTKNFLIYVLILDVVTLLQRVAINRYVTKKYKNIDFNSKYQLSKKEKDGIISKIKAMFIQKIGLFVINGTDSIVISATNGLGVIVVGLYANYLSITTTVTSLFEQVYKGITASFGDLAVNENRETQERVYNIISFIGFILYGLISVGFYFLLTPFIKMCFGAQYELDKVIVIFIIVNFYIAGLIASIDMIKEATGQYLVDKYVPLIQSIINLVVSIVLARYIGLLGVVLGTTISYITVTLWNRPYIAYKYIFKSSMKYFIKQQIKYMLTIIVSILILHLLFKYLIIGNAIVDFIVKGILCIIIFIMCLIVGFNKNDEFAFVRKEVLNKLNRKKV